MDSLILTFSHTGFHVIHIQKFKPSTIQILLWI